MEISEMRLQEIAEQAVSYLIDTGQLDDFLEDRDIDLTEEEREYFGTDESEV